MSLLTELTALLDALRLPVETGVFKSAAPDIYIVITPMADIFEGHADNQPLYEIQEARLSLFSKQNYRSCVKRIVRALLGAGITVTDRRYLGYEEESEYHSFAVDTAKQYELKEE